MSLPGAAFLFLGNLGLGLLDNGPHPGKDIVRQRIGFVGLQDVPGLFQCLFVHGETAGARPFVPHPAVDKRRLRHLFHVIERVTFRDKLVKGSYLSNDIDGQGLLGNRDSVDHVFDHSGELVVHDKLTVIKGYPGFEHAQSVNQVGTCQRRKQTGQCFLVGSLSIGKL